jgi:hypothetical protein
MKSRTVLLTLVTSAVIAFANILLANYLVGGNVSTRFEYAVFISLTPAVGALLWLRLRRVSLSWQQIAASYIVLYTTVSTIQSYARLIPVYQIVQRLVR